MSVANNNLFSQRDLIKARIESEKNQLKDVEEKIKKMYLPVGKEQLGSQKKDFGTTTVKLPQGEAKVTISKKSKEYLASRDLSNFISLAQKNFF